MAKQHNPGAVYASSYYSHQTRSWHATTWRRVATQGTQIQCRVGAHVKGYATSQAAERAALKAAGAAQ